MDKSKRNTFLVGTGFAMAAAIISVFVNWGLIRISGMDGLASLYNGQYMMVRGYNGELEISGVSLPIWVYSCFVILGETLYALSMLGIIRLSVWVGLGMVMLGGIGAILWIVSISSNGIVKMGPFLVLIATIITIVESLHYKKVA